MAHADPLDRYRDIAEACDKIREYAKGHTVESLRESSMASDAIERQLLIIAEAATRIGERVGRDIPDQPWRDIRGIGNVIRHRYDNVDARIIWDLIDKGRLENLAAAVRLYLAEGGTPHRGRED